MKKGKILVILISVIIILITIGSIYVLNNGNKTVTIKITYNNETNNANIKVGKILEYHLAGDTYKFKITNITNKQIKIEINKYGLTEYNEGGGIDLDAKTQKFVIEKNKQLKLGTQTMDYGENIIFEY